AGVPRAGERRAHSLRAGPPPRMRTRPDPTSATAGETARGRPAGGVAALRTGTPLRPRWRRRVATSRARAWLVTTPDAPPAGGWGHPHRRPWRRAWIRRWSAAPSATTTG